MCLQNKNCFCFPDNKLACPKKSWSSDVVKLLTKKKEFVFLKIKSCMCLQSEKLFLFSS